MLGHLRYSAVDGAPSSLSAAWNGILRNEMGFDGIIVTDDMVMLENSRRAGLRRSGANAVASIGAGTTLLLYVGPVDVGNVVASVAAAVTRRPHTGGDDRRRRSTASRTAT